MPGGRFHCPPKFGYFVSSQARAPVVPAVSNAARATTPIQYRFSISFLRHSDRSAILSRPAILLLLLRLLEVAQIGRRLVLPGGHEITVRAQEVVLLTDDHVIVVFGAVVLVPDAVGNVPIAFGHGPGARQRVVDGRDLVVQDARIGLVEIDALLDDGLVVLVQ